MRPLYLGRLSRRKPTQNPSTSLLTHCFNEDFADTQLGRLSATSSRMHPPNVHLLADLMCHRQLKVESGLAGDPHAAAALPPSPLSVNSWNVSSPSRLKNLAQAKAKSSSHALTSKTTSYLCSLAPHPPFHPATLKTRITWTFAHPIFVYERRQRCFVTRVALIWEFLDIAAACSVTTIKGVWSNTGHHIPLNSPTSPSGQYIIETNNKIEADLIRLNDPY